MTAKLSRVFGPAVLLEIGRGCDRQHARLDQLTGDESSGGGITEPRGCIESVGNQLTDRVAHDELELHLGMVVEKLHKGRGQHYSRKERIDVHAQAATDV